MFFIDAIYYSEPEIDDDTSEIIFSIFI
jgi:hypothetical protein